MDPRHEWALSQRELASSAHRLCACAEAMFMVFVGWLVVMYFLLLLVSSIVLGF